MKAILITTIIALIFISCVSASSTSEVEAYWISQGLSQVEASHIANNTASDDLISKAKVIDLENNPPQEPEPILNESTGEVIEETGISDKDAWALLFWSILTLMVLAGCLFLALCFGRVFD